LEFHFNEYLVPDVHFFEDIGMRHLLLFLPNFRISVGYLKVCFPFFVGCFSFSLQYYYENGRGLDRLDSKLNKSDGEESDLEQVR
jgi:hypothetical protein